MKQAFIRNLLIGVVLCSTASLILFGIVGIGRGSAFSGDFAILYQAGRKWLNFEDPYVQANPTDGLFAYPPQSAALFIPLALLDFQIAKIGLLLLNLVSIAALIFMTADTIKNRLGDRGHPFMILMAAFIIGNPFTNHNVWMGQTSLIAFAATMASWHFSLRERWVLSGIFLGLASFKPQLSILLFLWFLLERNWKVLFVSAGTIGMMCIYLLLTSGPVDMWVDWYQGITTYKASVFNEAGAQHVVGLESFFQAAGINMPTLKPLGVLLAFMLWYFRSRFNQVDLFGLLMGTSLTFVYGHDYDYVCLIPLFTSLLIYASEEFRLWFYLFPSIFLLTFPQRFVRIFGIPVLNHWRTIVVLITVSLVAFLSLQSKSMQVLKKSEGQSFIL
ncbi:MAG TPA: DUF2029 domain-containing protein [Synechococcales cyanobacterium M55_K2018_004]|nr:DUF2029 domain-containing protein [Synechococcales cyanobacterium M55_K2018_004]